MGGPRNREASAAALTPGPQTRERVLFSRVNEEQAPEQELQQVTRGWLHTSPGATGPSQHPAKAKDARKGLKDCPCCLNTSYGKRPGPGNPFPTTGGTCQGSTAAQHSPPTPGKQVQGGDCSRKQQVLTAQVQEPPSRQCHFPRASKNSRHVSVASHVPLTYTHR